MEEKNTNTAVVEQQKPPTEMEKLQARLAAVEMQLTIVEGLLLTAATGKVKGAQRFGGNHDAKPVLDTLTGIEYSSLSKCGLELGPQYGLPAHGATYYKLDIMFPGRFIRK